MKKFCRKCQVETERYVSGRRCKPCSAAYNAIWRKENPAKMKAINNAWRKENPAKARARAAKWRKENPAKIKTKSLQTTYKMPDGYIAAMMRQNNELLKGVPIPPAIIEAKRLHIKLLRLIKEIK